MSSRNESGQEHVSSEISELRLHMKDTVSFETSPRSLYCPEVWTSVQGTEDPGKVISWSRCISAFAVSLQTLKPRLWWTESIRNWMQGGTVQEIEAQQDCSCPYLSLFTRGQSGTFCRSACQWERRIFMGTKAHRMGGRHCACSGWGRDSEGEPQLPVHNEW